MGSMTQNTNILLDAGLRHPAETNKEYAYQMQIFKNKKRLFLHFSIRMRPRGLRLEWHLHFVNFANPIAFCLKGDMTRFSMFVSKFLFTLTFPAKCIDCYISVK